jgi:hypothetical protein
MIRRTAAIFAAVLLLLGFFPARSEAYAVLAHEALVDASWETGIRPLLLARFPAATTDDLRVAHGYAYGGAIIQDMGYYPHGSRAFSDILHYIRSADFIRALLRDSTDINEYAFALGALSHYWGDNEGHSMAVNRSVPILYPKLQHKYGDVITYADDPAAHLKTEFGFDVLQVADQHYASDAYHDFIGFEVSKPLLERAFEETYGITLDSLFADTDKAIGSYRYDVSTLIPKATKVAWQLKKDDIEKEAPTETRRAFLYHLSHASFNKEWGKTYQAPTFGERLVAFLYRFVPKFGPLRTLQFVTPTPQTETMFMASFNAAVVQYAAGLKQVSNGPPDMPNTNFDTGAALVPGKYAPADEAYAVLLDQLSKSQFKSVPPEMRADILNYYADTSIPFATKKNAKEWNRVIAELDALRAASPAAPPATNAAD